MRRACRLAPLAVLLWHLAAAAAAPAKYTDPDGWKRAPECVNWNEEDGPFGGFQPVDDFQEIIPERLYPAIYKKLNVPAWRKCCVPTFNLLSACYQASAPVHCGAANMCSRQRWLLPSAPSPCAAGRLLVDTTSTAAERLTCQI